MMLTAAPQRSSRSPCSTLAATLLWISVLLLALFPAPLALVARLYHALCGLFPALAVIGRVMPPLPFSLAVVLLVVIVGTALMTGVRELRATLIVARTIASLSAPLPPRLRNAALALGLWGRLTYLPTPAPAALCYHLLRPRIAITAGLMQRLDDEELRAVLLHERHHLTRRDPLRYLLLRTVAAGLFMAPLTASLRRRAETRMELAADRAALAVVPRGALAGALLAALGAPSGLPAGLAPLSATEARIAHLASRSEHSPIPYRATLATIALLVGLGIALAWLGRPEQTWELLCPLCPWLS